MLCALSAVCIIHCSVYRLWQNIIIYTSEAADLFFEKKKIVFLINQLMVDWNLPLVSKRGSAAAKMCIIQNNVLLTVNY